MAIKLFEQHGIPFDISTLFVTNVYSSEHKEIIINPEVKPYVDMGLRTAPIVVIKDLLSGEPITYWETFRLVRLMSLLIVD